MIVRAAQFALLSALVIAGGCIRGGNSPPAGLKIQYAYDDNGPSDVPAGAYALTPDNIAKAVAVRVGFLTAADGRRNGVEIEEAYAGDQPGSVQYKGRLFIRWSSIDGKPGTIERTVVIAGKKPWAAFVDWPDGSHQP